MWTRGLESIRSGTFVSRLRFSVSHQSKPADQDIDDFLHTINTSVHQTPAKSMQVLETSNEFSNWLERNPIKTFSELNDAARIAFNVKVDEQKKVFSVLDRLANTVLPTHYKQFGPSEIINAMRLLLQINPKSQLLGELEAMFLEKNVTTSDLLTVPFDTIVMFIRYSNASINQKVLDRIADVLIFRMEKELTDVAELFAILAGGYEKSKWFHNDTFIRTADKLVTFMGIGEKCALLKHMAVHKQRNKQLIGAIVNSVAYSTQCLTVSQLVSVTSSCSSLTYYPSKIAKKVAIDLERNSNILDKWDDVNSLAGSFVRMRMGNQKSWDLLIRWAIQNVKQANYDQLSRFVSGLARIGEPSGKPLVKFLKPLLKREKSTTPTAWLNTVYSLAYFQELDQDFADSVLNKSFVDQLMNSTMEVSDRLRKAMLLQLICSAAKVDMQGQYGGPTVNKATFAQYGINFDAKTIRNARVLKYSRNLSECENIFLSSLFKLAPQDTHCQPSNVEDCGAFVDAYVMPDEKSGLLVSQTQWGSTKPRPLFFYGWAQTKQNTESISDEINVLGQEQLGLRLIRADGFNPVIVFKTEFDYCSTDIDKVKMLRDKIHKK